MPLPRWQVWCDGSWSPKTKAGGWAYVVNDTMDSLEFHGPAKSKTTISRMELFSIYGALTVVPDNQPLLIHTASAYCFGVLTKWHAGWIRNGWKTMDGKPVENKSLIVRILNELRRLGEVEVVECKRDESELMTRAAELAKQGRADYREPPS